MQIYEITECLNNCNYTNYKIKIGEHQNMSLPGMGNDYNFTYTDMFYFYIPTSSITVKEEFLIYDWLSFAADCGGMGGILLGLSLLAGYQAFLELLQWVASGVESLTKPKNSVI